MMHELSNIVTTHFSAKVKGLKTVLATVVKLEGSSYRRPGVRMLLSSDGTFTGAVSGGCVEKEIWRQAQTVFSDDMPVVMTYDGRYRLGCEGILYVLIEPFEPDDDFKVAFKNTLSERKKIRCRSYYHPDNVKREHMGTHFSFDQFNFPARPGVQAQGLTDCFDHELGPGHRLLIIGAEHDAVQLTAFASLTGWEVIVVASASEEKSISHFPGAVHLLATNSEDLDLAWVDERTSVILMTHSYVKDLSYLMALRHSRPVYLGLLGPVARREKLLNELLERCPDTETDFLDLIHGPSGLNIGAETPQEIAISVLSEILSVSRKTRPEHLKDKMGAIHHP